MEGGGVVDEVEARLVGLATVEEVVARTVDEVVARVVDVVAARTVDATVDDTVEGTVDALVVEDVAIVLQVKPLTEP